MYRPVGCGEGDGVDGTVDSVQDCLLSQDIEVILIIEETTNTIVTVGASSSAQTHLNHNKQKYL